MSKWILHRPGYVAEVVCDLDVLLDAAEIAYHAIRVTLNGAVVYERLHDSHSAAERDAADARRDLLAAGWRDDLAWCRAHLSAAAAA